MLTRPGGGVVIRRGLTAGASESSTLSPAAETELAGALNRLQTHAELSENADLKLVIDRLGDRLPFPRPVVGEDRIFLDTVSALDDGAVIADFFLPYLCCSDCPPVHFVLPTPPLGLTVQLACTDADGNAQATLTPKGGVAPFSYQLDQQPYKELSGKVTLSVGVHTVTVRDGVGTESDPQSVAVPVALTLGAESYQDDLAAKSYRVTLAVSGGTPPYQAASGTLSDGNFTSDTVASDQTATVTITDSAGCSVSRQFTHSVTAPCTLPCQGIAARCGYRMWLPAPQPDLQDTYLEYGTQLRRFAFEFPQGTMVDLTPTVAAIMQATPADLNTKFDTVLQSWFDQINQAVAHAAGSDDWLRISYSRSPQEANGTITIERFGCLNFEFSLRSFFQRSQGTQLNLAIGYAPDGVRMSGVASTAGVMVPAYNCVQINKCDPNRTVTDPCQSVDLQLRVVKTVTSQGVTLDVAATGADQPVAYLWEVQDGSPPLSTTKQSSFSFTRTTPPGKTVRLSAFTGKGCRVMVVDQVVLG